MQTVLYIFGKAERKKPRVLGFLCFEKGSGATLYCRKICGIFEGFFVFASAAVYHIASKRVQKAPKITKPLYR